MDQISIDELPLRAAIDTGVLLRAFWHEEDAFAADPPTPLCRAFVTSMLDEGRTLLVSAVSLAEVLRFPGVRPTPRYRGLEVVAFDDQAARIFGTKLRDETLKDLIEETGHRRRAVMADALIVATAVRHRAEMIVSIDGGFSKLAKRVGLLSRTPDDFKARQTKLDFKG